MSHQPEAGLPGSPVSLCQDWFPGRSASGWWDISC